MNLGQSLRNVLVDEAPDALYRSLFEREREALKTLSRLDVGDFTGMKATSYAGLENLRSLDASFLAHVGMDNRTTEAIAALEQQFADVATRSTTAFESMRANLQTENSYTETMKAFESLASNRSSLSIASSLDKKLEDLKKSFAESHFCSLGGIQNEAIDKIRDAFNIDTSIETLLSVQKTQQEALNRLMKEAIGIAQIGEVTRVESETVADMLREVETLKLKHITALTHESGHSLVTKSASLPRKVGAKRADSRADASATPVTKQPPTLRVVPNEQYTEISAPPCVNPQQYAELSEALSVSLQSLARETANVFANHLNLPSRKAGLVYRCSTSPLHGAPIIKCCECRNEMVKLDVELGGRRVPVLLPRTGLYLSAKYWIGFTNE
jgi:hypothetical protein